MSVIVVGNSTHQLNQLAGEEIHPERRRMPRVDPPAARARIDRVRVGEYEARRDTLGQVTLQMPAGGDQAEAVAYLGIVRRGGIRVTRRGEPVLDQGPGDASVVAGWLPCEITAEQNTESYSLAIPRRTLDSYGIELTEPVRPLLPGSPLIHALVGLLHAITDGTVVPSGMSERRVICTLESLLTGIYLENDFFGGDEAARRCQARRRIAEHLDTVFVNPEVTLDSVAQHFAMSRRSLQRVFEGSGTSVTAELFRVRIEHALLILGDPARSHVTFVEVARLVGLTSASQLRRGTERFVGLSPSEYRARQIGEHSRASPDEIGG